MASSSLGDEVKMVKSPAYEAMLLSGTGQSDTNWLIRGGEMTEPCGTPACMWRCGARWPLYRQEAFLPRKYATSHLTKFSPSLELHIISKSSRWLTVLLGCFCRLKPSAILAVTKRRAEAVEWCDFKTCWESLVPRAAVSSGRTSRFRIFTAPSNRDSPKSL